MKHTFPFWLVILSHRTQHCSALIHLVLGALAVVAFLTIVYLILTPKQAFTLIWVIARAGCGHVHHVEVFLSFEESLTAESQHARLLFLVVLPAVGASVLLARETVAVPAGLAHGNLAVASDKLVLQGPSGAAGALICLAQAAGTGIS